MDYFWHPYREHLDPQNDVEIDGPLCEHEWEAIRDCNVSLWASASYSDSDQPQRGTNPSIKLLAFFTDGYCSERLLTEWLRTSLLENEDDAPDLQLSLDALQATAAEIETLMDDIKAKMAALPDRTKEADYGRT